MEQLKPLHAIHMSCSESPCLAAALINPPSPRLLPGKCVEKFLWHHSLQGCGSDLQAALYCPWQGQLGLCTAVVGWLGAFSSAGTS